MLAQTPMMISLGGIPCSVKLRIEYRMTTIMKMDHILASFPDDGSSKTLQSRSRQGSGFLPAAAGV